MAESKICLTPEESYEAGYRLVRENGWKLTEAERRRLAPLVRPIFLARHGITDEHASDAA